ncbi:MAG: hypothetical protein NDJ90_12900 [Oligoflexia bacterium]|nr:hypothetical protein [Oligoflexia bacterium]
MAKTKQARRSWAVAAVVGALLVAPAQAQERSSGGSEDAFVGALLGYGSASDDVGGGIGYGLRGGYYFHGNWGMGAFLQGVDHDAGITGLSIGLEGLYRLDEVARGLSAGVDLATVKFSGSAYEGDYNLGFGGRVVYDHRLPGATPLSVGAEVGVLFTKPEESMLGLVNVLGTVKYWF